jgi:Ohr subfamily peroxiredoxin
MNNPVYTASARVTGGRDKGRGWTPGGEVDLPLRLPHELGGKGDGANPEQLFAIGFAGCFEASMTVAAKRVGLPVSLISDVAIDAKVMLIPCDDGTFKLAAELDVELPSITDKAKAVEMVNATHDICPYSGAVRGNIEVATTVNGVALGALDVVLRSKAGVRPQPGGVDVVVRGPVGIATLREGDVRARNGGVDGGDDLAVPPATASRGRLMSSAAQRPRRTGAAAAS